MSQLSLLLKNFRLEAKAKLNTDELFFLEYPNELDLGLYVRLMPYTLKDKDQLNALEALPLSQQIKESSLAIHNKLDSINESLAKLLAQPQQSTLQLCTQLPDSMAVKGNAGYTLYQQLRFVERNVVLSQQNKLKISALFLQSLLGYFDLFTLMYFLHKSKFSAEQLVLNHPLFAGMDDSKKERLQLFATLLSDYKAGMERMQAIAEFANILCSLKDEGACYGFALYGLDPSLDALNALQRLNPSKTLRQIMQELATTLSNQLQPALITFDDFCNSAVFLRLQVNALPTATRKLRRNKDPLSLTLKMPRRDKATNPEASVAATLTKTAPEQNAKKQPQGLIQKSGQDQILGITLGTPEQTQAAQKALFTTTMGDIKISNTKKKTKKRTTSKTKNVNADTTKTSSVPSSDIFKSRASLNSHVSTPTAPAASAVSTTSSTSVAPTKAAIVTNENKASATVSQDTATTINAPKELPPINIDDQDEQQSNDKERAAKNKRQRVHDYTRPSMDVKYMRAFDALKNAEEQMQATQKIHTQIVGNNAMPVLSANQNSTITSSWQKPQSEVSEYMGLLQILDTSPELMRLKYCLLFAQYYLLPESDFIQLLHTTDPELQNAMETNLNINSDVKTEAAEAKSETTDSAITNDTYYAPSKAKIEPPDSIGDLNSGSAQGLQELIKETWNSPESQLLHSLLARKLRSPKELQTMHQVLLEMVSSSTEQQHTMSLQAAKFNYYARILGRDFTVIPNSQRTTESERRLLKTNIKKYDRNPFVQFLLATLILSAYSLYYKANRNGLFETYQHLQLRSPL